MRGQAQPHYPGFAVADGQLIVSRGLGTDTDGIDRVGLSLDNIVIDPVLYVRADVGSPKNAGIVGLIFGEEHRHTALAVEVVVV